MKRIVLITVIILAAGISSYGRKLVAEGNTNSALGKYRIEIDDSYITLNGFQHKPYVISFENSPLIARVAVTMEKGCRKYYVLSGDLSVQYVSNRNYFGVELLGKELKEDGFTTNVSSLNKTAYFHQKALTTGEKWRKDKTGLVATYFPLLLKNADNPLANN